MIKDAMRCLLALITLPLAAANPPCEFPPSSHASILKLTLPAGTRLAAGSRIAGRLNAPLIGEGRTLATAGSAVEFRVERAWKERAPGPKKSVWSWILRPLDFPARRQQIAASTATLEGGRQVPVQVLRISRGEKGQRLVWLKPQGDFAPQPLSSALTLPAGTTLRAALLTPLHSSLSRDGDAVHATLLEPVAAADGSTLPAGTAISARVTRARGARWLSRPGRLVLGFQSITPPCGSATELSASLSRLDASEPTAFRVDPEGAVSGGPQGKLKLLLHIGASYAIGKLVDDVMEEGLKAALGAAAGTAATAARYPSLGLGVFLFAMQRGREVSLPQYQEIEITLSRPLEFSSPPRP